MSPIYVYSAQNKIPNLKNGQIQSVPLIWLRMICSLQKYKNKVLNLLSLAVENWRR